MYWYLLFMIYDKWIETTKFIQHKLHIHTKQSNNNEFRWIWNVLHFLQAKSFLPYFEKPALQTPKSLTLLNLTLLRLFLPKHVDGIFQNSPRQTAWYQSGWKGGKLILFNIVDLVYLILNASLNIQLHITVPLNSSLFCYCS